MIEESKYYDFHELSVAMGLQGYPKALLISSYISLGTNFSVSSAIILRLWKAKQEARRLLGDAGLSKAYIPYSRLVSVLFQSALPPFLLGLSHLIAYLGFHTLYRTHGALWVSFTVSLIDSFIPTFT